MSWTNWPVNDGTGSEDASDIQAYYLYLEFLKAIRERSTITGTGLFRVASTYEGGTIESLDEGTDDTIILTDSTKDWVIRSGCTGISRWVNYSCPDAPSIASYYDVVIPDIDTDLYVRAQIVANDETTLTFNRTKLENLVTANIIPSIDSLVGKSYNIIKRDGLSLADMDYNLGRWPTFPNDNELDKGSVSSSTTTTLTIDPISPTGIYPTRKLWEVNEFAGKDLLVFVGDKLERKTITSNTKDKLTFPAMSGSPSGDYIILEAGGRGMPGRQAWKPFQHYSGCMDYYHVHGPDDFISSAQFPASSKTWSTGYGGICNDITVAALDVDVWTEVDEECTEADKCFSPHLWKSIRGLQLAVEMLAGSFIEPKDYNGLKDVHNFTMAEFFYSAGINGGESSVSHDSANYVFSVDSEYDGFAVHYTILHDDAIVSAGSGVVVDGIVTIGEYPVDPDPDPDWTGYQVVYSAGWTRYYPQEFSYMYDRAVFIPDTDSVDGEVIIIDPPAIDFEESGCNGIGQWILNPASSTLKVYGDYGFSGDGRELQAGDIARYTGDNYSDPGTGTIVAVGDEGPELLLPYWDRFFEGQHSKPPYGNAQHALKVDRLGTCDSSTENSVTDDSKNWWSYWYGGGVLRVEEFTATGGSTTHAELPAEYVDSESASSCFWKPERFAGFDGPYVGFILEVDKAIGSETVTFKLPITGVTGRNVEFDAVHEFTVAGGVEEDDICRIREPAYNLNRFKGSIVRFTDPNGNHYEAPITHNDDKTLFFTPPEGSGTFTVNENPSEPNWTFEILQHDTGGVWQWDGSKWIVPPEEDSRGAPRKKDQTCNLPLKEKSYGRVIKGDYIAYHIFDELYRAINKLRWTKIGVTWTAQYPLPDPPADESEAATAAWNDSRYKCNFAIGDWSLCLNAVFFPEAIDTWHKAYEWIRDGGTIPDDFTIGAIRDFKDSVFDSAYAMMDVAYFTPPTRDSWTEEGVRPHCFSYNSKAEQWNKAYSGFVSCFNVLHIEEHVSQPKINGIPTSLACSKQILAKISKATDHSDWLRVITDYLEYSFENNFELVGDITGLPVDGTYFTTDEISASAVSECAGKYFPIEPDQNVDIDYWKDYVDFYVSGYEIDEVIIPNYKMPDLQISIPEAPDCTYFREAVPEDAPDEGREFHGIQQGFQVTDEIAILKWDVEGGLNYVD